MRYTVREAKRLILERFNPAVDLLSVYHKYDEQEYIDLLDALESSIPFSSTSKYDYPSRLFLYAGCLRFDRWVAPSPLVVPPGLADRFSRFVNALKRVEGDNPNNVSTFLLHKVKYDLFQTMESVPLAEVETDTIERFEKKIEAIPSPVDRVKLEEFLREKGDIDALLSGFRDASLRTRITTQIPYIVHLRPLLIDFVWCGIPTTVSLTPTFYKPKSVAEIQPASQPVGPSRWQSGVTDIVIEFSALVDGDAWTPPLLSFDPSRLPFDASPFDGWPKAFTIAFSIVHDLVWIIRVKYEGEKQWIPVPRDFTCIEWEIYSSARKRIEWKIKGSPGALLKGFTPSEEVKAIKLEVLESIPWYARCRSLAAMYLEIGETNEAVFWLNVGVEALFQSRFQEFASTLAKPGLEQELSSSKAYWDLAREVVAEQCPGIADKIEWPETEAYVSMYKRIKYLYKMIPMKTSVEETLAHYSRVSKHRNALFHGTTEERLPVHVVKEAMDSFDWLEQNFTLAEHDPTDKATRNGPAT